MHQKKHFKDSKSSIDLSHSRSNDDNSNKSPRIEEHVVIDDEDTQVLIDTDNEEEITSSGISGDEEVEEEEEEDDDNNDENMSSGNSFEEGNILQPLNLHKHHRSNLNDLLNTNPNSHITLIQSDTFIEATQINNDQLISQTMAVLAAKHKHEKSTNSPPMRSEILSFVGPCPLYSLASSFGLDMHHGLSYFPCRDVLANGGGHRSALPLWQHLTTLHNLNFPSSSLVISHLLLHGYSIPAPIIFNSTYTKPILRTTPRYSLFKKCPLTKYGVYGIRYEHGTRLCSGFTCNTNIYSHLISFHKMTNDAALRLSRAIAFHDKHFQFQSTEHILNEHRKSSRFKRRSRKVDHHCQLFPKLIKEKPVKK